LDQIELKLASVKSLEQQTIQDGHHY